MDEDDENQFHIVPKIKLQRLRIENIQDEKLKQNIQNSKLRKLIFEIVKSKYPKRTLER